MTPTEQNASSVRYICTQFCAVPQPDGTLALFISYGPTRTYQGIFTPAELADFLRADFEKQSRVHERRKEADERATREQAARQQSLDAIDIDFTI